MEDYFYVGSKIHHESEPLPKAEIPNESGVINWVILGSNLVNPLSHHVPKLMDISDRKGNETRNQDLSSHFVSYWHSLFSYALSSPFSF